LTNCESSVGMSMLYAGTLVRSYVDGGAFVGAAA
jgi:hypothetical protein